MDDELYLLGNRGCLEQKRIAVVGTRMMSAYGKEVCVQFVKKLVEEQWCIVSGLARGIDRVAHETVLQYSGKTIAVLGHGLDQCYPREHEPLKQRIVVQGGLLATQYSEGVGPQPEHFRERDKLMVKLSQAVLVIECPRRSGVKITVTEAANEGKSVYVVPGPITQASYHGSVEIIRDGGIPVYNPQDLLEQLRYTDNL